MGKLGRVHPRRSKSAKKQGISSDRFCYCVHRDYVKYPLDEVDDMAAKTLTHYGGSR